MYWLIDIIKNNTGDSIVSGAPGILRLLLGFSLLWKFALESHRGYFEYFKPHTYLFSFYQAPRRGKGKLNERIWKLLYVLKVIAAPLLMLGIVPKLCILALMAWFALEMRIYFKYHANFFFLLLIALLTSDSMSTSFSLPLYLASGSFHDFVVSSISTKDSMLPHFLVIATVCSMYFFTAIHKANKRFISGEVVSRTLHLIEQSRPFRKHFDFWIPGVTLRLLAKPSGEPTSFLFVLMVFTWVSELLLLPIGLNLKFLQPAAILSGVALHLGFLIMFPAALLHFSLISISCYLMFVDPKVLASVLMKITH